MSERNWQLVLLRPAQRYLSRLPPDEQDRVLNALESLQQDPTTAPVKPLKSRPEWRLRIGQRRALLRVDRDAQKIIVVSIGPRGDVYK